MQCLTTACPMIHREGSDSTFFALSSASISPDRLNSLLNLLMACWSSNSTSRALGFCMQGHVGDGKQPVLADACKFEEALNNSQSPLIALTVCRAPLMLQQTSPVTYRSYTRVSWAPVTTQALGYFTPDDTKGPLCDVLPRDGLCALQALHGNDGHFGPAWQLGSFGASAE